LAGTNSYCLMTEAHKCEPLAQGCYAALLSTQTNNLYSAKINK